MVLAAVIRVTGDVEEAVGEEESCMSGMSSVSKSVDFGRDEDEGAMEDFPPKFL